LTKELDEKLVAEFPKIFKDRHASVMESAMSWGFECEDGWYDLIHDLCSCIQSYIDNNKRPQIVALQVKEKWGSLRFYWRAEQDMDPEDHSLIHGMVWFAEYISACTCEICGKRGIISERKGRYGCRCSDH
jgi:hypothetical protein